MKLLITTEVLTAIPHEVVRAIRSFCQQWEQQWHQLQRPPLQFNWREVLSTISTPEDMSEMAFAALLSRELACSLQRLMDDFPIAPSWRGYHLAVAVVTHSWIYLGSNFKPLPTEISEECGHPKIRTCGEVDGIKAATFYRDTEFRLITLVGCHHNNGNGHIPKPCDSCKRFFTTLSGHRNLPLLQYNPHADTTEIGTLGDILDEYAPLTVQCGCCTPRKATWQEWLLFQSNRFLRWLLRISN